MPRRWPQLRLRRYTKLGYYAQGVDPPEIPPCPPPFTVDTAGVPEAQIPAQTTLYNTVGPRHLKVMDGLMVEMTQAEKDAVDSASPATRRGHRGGQTGDTDE